MANCYKAQEASYKSIEYVTAKDKESWLDLFSDDAVIQDPVGESPLDPTGLGHRGKDAISKFWDMIIAPGNASFTIQCSLPAGDECANVAEVINRMPGGVEIKVDMVVVYTANDDGKFTSLKAYWEYKKVQDALEQALAQN
jgi:steroid delta-isomerase